eukprot:gnl/MRDRNA2_/MRDRNA2_19598_c0_seq1.p1 gnl/MRDRNA2_/MRDRNA2_19598_c0~~gnl/MRDRNA2_/MRDRNA2_19598_c0_seq1.p1  ORF type:complete len:1331 (+),score=304.94 gnl/MRDRNA2_/MRDRNA2_19598_c0_seq1:279-3995(+)
MANKTKNALLYNAYFRMVSMSTIFFLPFEVDQLLEPFACLERDQKVYVQAFPDVECNYADPTYSTMLKISAVGMMIVFAIAGWLIYCVKLSYYWQFEKRARDHIPWYVSAVEVSVEDMVGFHEPVRLRVFENALAIQSFDIDPDLLAVREQVSSANARLFGEEGEAWNSHLTDHARKLISQQQGGADDEDWLQSAMIVQRRRSIEAGKEMFLEMATWCQNPVQKPIGNVLTYGFVLLINTFYRQLALNTVMKITLNFPAMGAAVEALVFGLNSALLFALRPYQFNILNIQEGTLTALMFLILWMMVVKELLMAQKEAERYGNEIALTNRLIEILAITIVFGILYVIFDNISTLLVGFLAKQSGDSEDCLNEIYMVQKVREERAAQERAENATKDAEEKKAWAEAMAARGDADAAKLLEEMGLDVPGFDPKYMTEEFMQNLAENDVMNLTMLTQEIDAEYLGVDNQNEGFTSIGSNGNEHHWLWRTEQECKNVSILVAGTAGDSPKLKDVNLPIGDQIAMVKKLEEEFLNAGLNLTLFGVGQAASIPRIAEELSKKEWKLCQDGHEFKRVVQITCCRIKTPDGRYLTKESEILQSGKRRERKSLPGRQQPPGKTPEETIRDVIRKELNVKIPKSQLSEFLLSDEELWDPWDSPAYPGIPSLYRMRFVDVDLMMLMEDPPVWSTMGLQKPKDSVMRDYIRQKKEKEIERRRAAGAPTLKDKMRELGLGNAEGAPDEPDRVEKTFHRVETDVSELGQPSSSQIVTASGSAGHRLSQTVLPKQPNADDGVNTSTGSPPGSTEGQPSARTDIQTARDLPRPLLNAQEENLFDDLGLEIPANQEENQPPANSEMASASSDARKEPKPKVQRRRSSAAKVDSKAKAKSTPHHEEQVTSAGVDVTEKSVTKEKSDGSGSGSGPSSGPSGAAASGPSSGPSAGASAPSEATTALPPPEQSLTGTALPSPEGKTEAPHKRKQSKAEGSWARVRSSSVGKARRKSEGKVEVDGAKEKPRKKSASNIMMTNEGGDVIPSLPSVPPEGDIHVAKPRKKSTGNIKAVENGEQQSDAGAEHKRGRKKSTGAIQKPKEDVDVTPRDDTEFTESTLLATLMDIGDTDVGTEPISFGPSTSTTATERKRERRARNAARHAEDAPGVPSSSSSQSVNPALTATEDEALLEALMAGGDGSIFGAGSGLDHADEMQALDFLSLGPIGEEPSDFDPDTMPTGKKDKKEKREKKRKKSPGK